jgi:hypothetical protein
MNMHLRSLAVFVVASILIAPGTVGKDFTTIDWNDLLPSEFFATEKQADLLQERLEALPDSAKTAVQKIRSQRALRKNIAEGSFKTEDLSLDNKKLIETDYVAKFPQAAAFVNDVALLIAEYDALDQATNSDLDGETVRMPGYVLPLEFDGTKTIEFLLVPTVGACIHVPAPAPNQIVHVRFPSGFESQGLYAPVFVTGRISAIGATVDLSLVDGQSPVETGYRLEATLIEPYKG